MKPLLEHCFNEQIKRPRVLIEVFLGKSNPDPFPIEVTHAVR